MRAHAPRRVFILNGADYKLLLLVDYTRGGGSSGAGLSEGEAATSVVMRVDPTSTDGARVTVGDAIAAGAQGAID
jgi:hypothetical protein